MPIESVLDSLLYRDAMMLVLNKPAGIPVHKGRGGGETLDQHFSALRFGLPRDPALAHRLDRDTGGCLVLGRHRQALARLGRLFEQGKVEKTYWAIVEGVPENHEGELNFPLAKRVDDPAMWHMEVSEHGQSARTTYRLLAHNGAQAWLELSPKTGRTHQLRVHCAAMGHPIVGDKIYGTKGAHLFLHARSVCVPLYPKKPPVMVEAPAGEAMQHALEAFTTSATTSASQAAE